MTFSYGDLYPNMVSNQLPTTSQTIPIDDNEMEYGGITDPNSPDENPTISANENGMRTNGASKNLIYGSLILLVSVMVLIHFID